MTLEKLWQRYQVELEAELRRSLEGHSLPFYQMMRYHLGWCDAQGLPTQAGSGKRLRPILCLLACESVGGNYHVALPAAAALELVHNFSLIHDDIEDASPQRRHRPTVWCLWGRAQAINAGDGMHALARLVLLRLEDFGIPPEQVLHSARILDETCLHLCEGQFLDLSFEERIEVGLEEYLAMIEGKTASLFAASLQLGALLGGAREDIIESYRRCGLKLGLAFQMQDDLLGIWGVEADTGKPVAGDIRSKKKTLPLVYALSRASTPEKEELRHIYQKGMLEEEDVLRVLAILEDLAARQHAQAMAEACYAEAIAELAAARIVPPALSELRDLAAFLVQRQY